MEKVIVRKNILLPGYVNSEYGRLVFGDIRSKKNCSKQELIDYCGIADLMDRLFKERIEVSNLESSILYKSYLSVVKSKKDNDDFIVAHRWDEDFAVHIDDKISLYRLVPYHYVCSTITPWFYAEGNTYIGDNACEESDETILESLCELSTVEFLRKYRGYKYI